MPKKPRSLVRSRLHLGLIREGLLARIRHRVATAGTLKIPAVPALLDHYLGVCSDLFMVAGRSFTAEERATAANTLATRLEEAFTGSPRSKLAIEYCAEPARPLGYGVRAEISSLADAYERWIGTSDGPLFGAEPDARVLAVAREIQDPRACRVLDLGAGTGRNALALARLGFPVDAVEITPKFAELLRLEAEKHGLPVNVIVADVLREPAALNSGYGLFIASEVVPDFRSGADLRRLFELAAQVLCLGGRLVFNLHLALHGYTPERSAREFSQQCYSAIFTTHEVVVASSHLPLLLCANDSVHDYEREHLPTSAWPPTPWYINWTSGLDVYDLAVEECPIELRWLVYQKAPTEPSDWSRDSSVSLLARGRRVRRLDPTALGQALVRRLMRRSTAAGTFTLPAVPAMLELYLDLCFSTFRALGRDFSAEQQTEGRALLQQTLDTAFNDSGRSNVVIEFEAPLGSDLRYTFSADPVPLTALYQQWLEDLPPPLFGAEPDARLLAVLAEFPQHDPLRILDLGAGLGRNALPLARGGHLVDAVDLTPEFISRLEAVRAEENLPVRTLTGNVFELRADLRCDYGLILASGLVADFRSTVELRELFELAVERLLVGGILLISVHLAVESYLPELVARQWAQQCCSMFFTRVELASAISGLPLSLQSDDSAHDFERQHLPSSSWPPTEAYPEWALAQHMYALVRADCPVELRWLVFRKLRPA